MTLRTFSYGGGVQSTAALVLAAQGRIDFRTFLFSNVGDDSENPASLEYVRNIAMPYAEAHGIELHELGRVRKDGTPVTLMGLMTKEGSRSVGIPVRMSNGAPASRSCTVDFKINVISKWMKARGASKTEKGVCGIGISTDEMQRARGASGIETHELEYPLLTLGMSRGDCMALIKSEGLPMPEKSSCFFCPFHSLQTWVEMRRDERELFDKSVALERFLNERRAAAGQDSVWLTRFGKPLDEVVGTHTQETLWGGNSIGETGCDEGVCFV